VLSDELVEFEQFRKRQQILKGSDNTKEFKEAQEKLERMVNDTIKSQDSSIINMKRKSHTQGQNIEKDKMTKQKS